MTTIVRGSDVFRRFHSFYRSDALREPPRLETNRLEGCSKSKVRITSREQRKIGQVTWTQLHWSSFPEDFPVHHPPFR